MNLLDKINFEGELLKLKRNASGIAGLSEIADGFLRTYESNEPLSVAKAFVSQTAKFEFEPSVKVLRESILNEYKDNTFRLELQAVKNNVEDLNSPFYKSVLECMEEILSKETEKDIKSGIKQKLSSHSFIPQIKSLVEYVNKVDQEINNSASHYAKTVYSPVIEKEGAFYFNALGVNYAVTENEIRVVSMPDDATYAKLVEAVNTFEITDDAITHYSNDNKIEVSLDENNEVQLKVQGKKIEINENLNQHLVTTRVFDAKSIDKMKMLRLVIDNYNSIVRLDNVKQLHMRNQNDKKINVLTLENKIGVHKLNYVSNQSYMNIHEFAHTAIEDVKDFMGYDLSESLVDYLKADLSKVEEFKKERINILEKVEFLKEKKSELEDSGLLENTEVQEALELVSSELGLHIKKLKEISEKIAQFSEKKTSMEDEGYIEGIVKGNVPSKFKKEVEKGDTVYIYAEDYTTSGASDDIKVKTEQGSPMLLPKKSVAPTN